MVDAAKIAALRERIQNLTPDARLKFRDKLEAQGIEWASIAPLADGQEQVTRPDKLPLSPEQKHLWILHQLYPALSAYHIAFAWHFSGTLNIGALQASIDHVINRHEALRTSFPSDADGNPYQQIVSAADRTPLVLNIKAIGDASGLHSQLETVAAQPFDLASGPLIRLEVLESGSQNYSLVVVLHHLIADGWSRGIFLQEVATSYRAFYCDEVPNFPVLALQPADLTIKAADNARDQSKIRSLSWWRKQLTAAKPAGIPAARKPSGEINFAGAMYTATLPRDLADSVRSLAVANDASLFQTFLTLFFMVLYRYSGKEDMTIGVPVAGREDPASAQLIGFFVNTLALRCDFEHADARCFASWVETVKESFANSIEHGQVPFSDVVDTLGVARESARNPLFDVMFQLQSDSYGSQNAATLDTPWPDLAVEQQPIALPETKFDLTWHMFDRNNEILVAIEYRTALYSVERIEDLYRHFNHLITSVVAAPQAPVGTHTLLSAGEFAKQLTAAQGPSLVRSQPAVFHSAFQQQAARTPREVAVTDASASVTFADVEVRATAVAAHLSARGLGLEDRVGVCMHRSANLVPALIGVLMSGAAFVPLDPSLPAMRLAKIVRDAGCKVVLSDNSDDDAKQIFGDTPVLLDAEIDSNVKAIAAVDTQPNNLAYVMYTSGSSGEPKGVEISHAALMSYIEWCLATYPWSQGNGAPVQSSIGFDATITSLLAPLIAGCTVHLLPEEEALVALAAALESELSLVKLTPAHLQSVTPLLDSKILPASLPSAFVIGGEALTTAHVAWWQEHYPAIQLINEYGPTEATVGCANYTVRGNEGDAIPIGHPIAGAELYLLDSAMNLLPDGLPGEIYIGGAGLARAYHNQGAQSAAAFVPNPYATADNKLSTLLYRTGDLAQRLASGDMVYLGRLDEQFQLRGYRIEPGDIEAALTRHADVAEAAVAIRQRANRPALIAYVKRSGAESAPNAAHQWREFLKNQLPPWMVPDLFVEVEALPLTANGKLDRDALPAPTIREQSEKVSPRSDIEVVLVNAWREVLGLEAIGITDNFFEIGGDSIGVMQIVARVRQAGWHFEPRDLFDHQTIEALAGRAYRRDETANKEEKLPSEAFELSPIQWQFLANDPIAPSHFNQSILLEVNERLDLERLREAVDAINERHATLRLRFEKTTKENGEAIWCQRYSPVERGQIPVEEISIDGDEKTLATSIAERQTYLDIASGPVLSLSFIKRANAIGDRLLLVAHHLVMDGVSWRILLNDLQLAYGTAMRAEQLSTDSQITSSSFYRWREHLVDNLPRFETQRDYWADICRMNGVLPKDFDDIAPPVIENVEEVVATIPNDHLEDGKPGKLLEQQLIAAMFATVSRWTGLGSVVIDIEGHGRHQFDQSIDISQTLGWFTVRYPLAL
ncbi:MAG: amino acid adenylation domain-containing protein, partial [Pseudomonadota bacterium]